MNEMRGHMSESKCQKICCQCFVLCFFRLEGGGHRYLNFEQEQNYHVPSPVRCHGLHQDVICENNGFCFDRLILTHANMMLFPAPINVERRFHVSWWRIILSIHVHNGGRGANFVARTSLATHLRWMNTDSRTPIVNPIYKVLVFLLQLNYQLEGIWQLFAEKSCLKNEATYWFYGNSSLFVSSLCQW